MRRLFQLLLVVTAVAFLLGGKAMAFTLEDISAVVGSGTNQSALVIDWNDGRDNESLAWRFLWSGTATGLDMLKAIDAADPRLEVAFRSTNSGSITFGIAYDTDNSGNSFTFTQIGDETATTDPPDHLKEGWFYEGYWQYYVGANGDNLPSWSSSAIGAASRQLVNNSWDAWSFANAFTSSSPGTPVSAGLVVPEPSVTAMLGFGALLLRRRRRG